MNILLTGSEGSIGRHLVRRLQGQGHTVRGLDLAEKASADYGYTSGDLCDFAAVLKCAAGAEAVIHAGAVPADRDGREDDVLAANAQGTWNVLLACVRHDIGRVVHFSSINALGAVGSLSPRAYLPITDDYPHRPLTPYQIGKHLSEETCKAFSDRWGIVTVSLRPMWVLSKEMRRHWREKPASERLPRETGMGEWVALEEVGDATLSSLTVEGITHDAFLLSAPTTLYDTPTLEVVRQNYSDVPWPRVSPEEWTRDSPHRALFDCSHAADVLNWHPKIDWRTG